MVDGIAIFICLPRICIVILFADTLGMLCGDAEMPERCCTLGYRHCGRALYGGH